MFEGLDKKRFRDAPVAVLTGGTSREREISLQTGAAFEDALRERDYRVKVYDVATDLPDLSGDRPAVALLGLHGGLGERGALQGYLECLEIPYTGSGVLASALAMDKQRTRTISACAGVPVAQALWFDAQSSLNIASGVDQVIDELGLPVVAKLNDSGSSFGVYICRERQDLAEAFRALEEELEASSSSGILVETFIDGPEYTVGLFDDRCLGVIEIQPGQEFYNFKAKYESTQTGYEMIADPDIREPLVQWARQAYQTLGCRGVVRVDFKGQPETSGAAVMLEVNTIPGMTSTSLIPKMAAQQGVPFEDFVEAMLVAARLDAG